MTPAHHWPVVLADIAAALGVVVGEPLARQLMVPGVVVRCWLAGAEPTRKDGEMLLSRWRVLTMRPVEFAPKVVLAPHARAQSVTVLSAAEQPALASPLLGPLEGKVVQPAGCTATVMHWLREARGAWVRAQVLRVDIQRQDVVHSRQAVSSVLAKLQERQLAESSGPRRPIQYRWRL